MRWVLPVLIFCFAGVARAATLDEIAANPAGTGGLVVLVLADSQAASAGVKPGDILLAYQGTAIKSPKDLVDAIAAHKADAGSIAVNCLRDGQAVDVSVKPGRLGVRIISVEKGKPLQLRPPATPVVFDLSSLKDRPRDLWYTFEIAGKHVGFEHEKLEIKDNRLQIVSEVAFDSTEYGLQHFLVQTTATTDPIPALIELHYEAPLEAKGYLSTMTPHGDKLHVEVVDSGKTESRDVTIPADAMADYLVAQLAAFMPLTHGTCLHFTLLDLNGDASEPAGLCVGDTTTITNGGLITRRCEVAVYALGEKTRAAWVDADSRIIESYDYGHHAQARRSTRDQALAGVNEKLKPKS